MSAILLIIIIFAGYLIAYHTYGRYLGRKLFKLSVKNKMPSETNFDGIDHVPTPKHIVFGHHFTTIAGLGPIVGPAIGIIWGWLPALLWIFFGSVFMGSVHDFSTMIVSARKKGKTIGDLTGEIISPGSMIAFQLIIQLLLIIVLSVFALIVSTLFILYPQVVIPVWFQIPLAMVIGRYLRKGGREIFYALLALVFMYISIYAGILFPVDLQNISFVADFASGFKNPADVITIIWCILLFIYVYFASILPVQSLLQPRDYINSLQLFLALAVIVIGVVILDPELSAPAINSAVFKPGNDVPDMAPVLFIVIACGAISGFHSIASSGTTVKQVTNERDVLLVGYGSMLAEGFLAVIVLVCIAGGLGLGMERDGRLFTGSEAFYQYYSSWEGATSGIAVKLESFIIGASNLISGLGIPKVYARPLLAVFIVSFANTTLDSATRMQRISLQDLLSRNTWLNKKSFSSNRFIITLLVVCFAGFLTFMKPGGKGALVLWPLFGSLNQLLAGLGLAVISVYLYKLRKNFYLAFIPMIFVLFMTIWSMVSGLADFIKDSDYFLSGLTGIILILTIWLICGGIKTVLITKISA